MPIEVDFGSQQRYRIFFFRWHGRWLFIHSNPKIVLFFFSAKEKNPEKKIQAFFFQEKFIGHFSILGLWEPISGFGNN